MPMVEGHDGRHDHCDHHQDLGGPHLAKPHIQRALSVLLCVRLQLQSRSLLDRLVMHRDDGDDDSGDWDDDDKLLSNLVMHRLQSVAGVEPTEDDLADLVPGMLVMRRTEMKMMMMFLYPIVSAREQRLPKVARSFI